MMTTDASLEARVSALENAVNDVVRVGKIAAVQQRPYRVQVDVGVAGSPVTTGWLPVLLPRAGETLAFSPLSVGEGCLLLAPGGSDAVAYVLPALATGRIEPVVRGGAESRGTYLMGDLHVSGRVIVHGDVRAGGPEGVSVLGHTHTQVKPGAGTSGGPSP